MTASRRLGTALLSLVPFDDQPAARSDMHDIDRIFAKTVRNARVKESATAGATDDGIDRLVALQGAYRVPDTLRRILRLVGAAKGPWWVDDELSVACDDVRDTKNEAIDTHEHEVHGSLGDAVGMLVLTCHDGCEWEVLDGTDSHRANPPVWRLTDSGRLEQCDSSLTDWFARASIDVECHRKALRSAFGAQWYDWKSQQ